MNAGCYSSEIQPFLGGKKAVPVTYNRVVESTYIHTQRVVEACSF